jgi:hypothetical protein
MNGRRSWRTTCGLGLALALAAAVAGQPPAPAPPSAEPSAPQAGQYVGPASCASSNCHGAVRPRRVFDVLQNEHFTWFKGGDRHYTAWRVLFNDRSRVIARNLELPVSPSESPACLSCHGMAVAKEKQAVPLEIEDGISCEGCHGPAGGWIREHTAQDWTHRQSVTAGMADLRDLDVRSRLCLSCHLGAPGQTVDHELIAAGHPLLSFELDNYTEDMPAHWMPLRDKQRKEGLRDTHGLRAWAVGQAASFRAGLDQLARRARSPRWPEFSEMSCDSCHHSLTEQRWKTVRNPERPGLPRWSPARWAVLRHLVTAVAPDARESLDAGVARLTRQTSRFSTPPAEVAETAERISRTLGSVVPRLDQAAWDDAEAKRLLLAISEDADAFAVADPAAAEQAFLAFNSLVVQLQAGNPRRVRAGLAGTLETMKRELDDPYTWNPSRFKSQLARLRKQAQGIP